MDIHYVLSLFYVYYIHLSFYTKKNMKKTPNLIKLTLLLFLDQANVTLVYSEVAVSAISTKMVRTLEWNYLRNLLNAAARGRLVTITCWEKML